MRAIVLLLAAMLLAGCSPPKEATDRVVIAPDRYEAAFTTARELLRECRFTPERVDARAGVITTEAKSSAGLATPWDLEQASLYDEMSDLVNDNARRVRVTFTPQHRPEPDVDDPLGEPIPDVRLAEAPLEMRVQVFLERTRRPGWRLEPTGIGLSSYELDGSLPARGMWPRYTQVVRRDDELARRLANTIALRLGMEGSAAEAGSE